MRYLKLTKKHSSHKERLNYLIFFYIYFKVLFVLYFYGFDALVDLIKNTLKRDLNKNYDFQKILRIEKNFFSFFGIKKCLIRSSFAYLLLKYFGHECNFYIGVKKEDNKFFSHAWLETQSEENFLKKNNYKIIFKYPNKKC